MDNILLITPDFFGYYKDITNELINQNYIVDWYSDRPNSNLIGKMIIRLNKKLMRSKVIKYIDKIINENDKDYKYVVIILGQSFIIDDIKRLKAKYKNAKFVYYNWDSVDVFEEILTLSTEFDSVMTFDPFDAKKYKFTFLPLFYSDEFKNLINKNELFDYLYIGTAKPGKIENINKILKMINQKKIFFHMYIQSRLVFIYYYFTNKEFRMTKTNFYKYNKISRKSLLEYMRNSKIIIDIPQKNQKGLTMRTFEVLASNKKLITTNSDIANYDFYSRDRILIFTSRTNIYDIDEFYKTNLESDFNMDKYHIKNWVKRLLED